MTVRIKRNGKELPAALGSGWYLVYNDSCPSEFKCTCMDFIKTGFKCNHIHVIEVLLKDLSKEGMFPFYSNRKIIPLRFAVA